MTKQLMSVKKDSTPASPSMKHHSIQKHVSNVLVSPYELYDRNEMPIRSVVTRI